MSSKATPVALEPAPPAVPVSRPSAAQGIALVIERLAADQSVDVEKMERIIAMQERLMAIDAKVAFDAAFAAMQGELPVIAERGKTDKAKYATLEDIIEIVRPILCRHGFSLSHRTDWSDPSRVRIVGILAHQRGHEKTSEFLTAPDTSGSKNAVQALGSALSYGRRYTTMDLLNIVTRYEDDDASRAVKPAVPEPEIPAGYEAWFDDMQTVAEEGTKQLTAAWNASKPEFKAFAVKYRNAAWSNCKAKAAAADKGARRG